MQLVCSFMECQPFFFGEMYVFDVRKGNWEEREKFAEQLHAFEAI
jgi:hypothetical protein